MIHFSAKQKRILTALFLTYTTTYLARTNLAPSLPAIAESFQLTGAQTGLIASLFAIPYAAGQLVIGTLTDTIRYPRLMFIGTLTSALINLFFSFASSYPALLILWALNGCAQSMVWTPLLHVLSLEFHGPQRDRASFTISFTLIFGYIIAWFMSGMLTGLFSWRISFRTTAALVTILTVICWFLLGDGGRKENTEDISSGVESEEVREGGPVSILWLITRTSLGLLLLCSVVNGYIRDSILTWAPDMLMSIQSVNINSTVLTSLIVPIISSCGILAGKKLYGKMNRSVPRSLLVLYTCCAFLSLLLILLFGRIGLLLSALLLGLCVSMCSGCNPILTSISPMNYKKYGRMATAAGLIDALIYIGSSLSGFITGALRDFGGWNSVFFSWILAALTGISLLLLLLRKESRERTRCST